MVGQPFQSYFGQQSQVSFTKGPKAADESAFSLIFLMPDEFCQIKEVEACYRMKLFQAHCVYGLMCNFFSIVIVFFTIFRPTSP